VIRRFPNKIADIIEAKGLRLNTISKTSGISYTYLTNLVKGKINRPGKAKIASILLALNFSISEINKVLAEYDYRSLSQLDIPDILTNNQKRKIEGKTRLNMIVFTLISFYRPSMLMIANMEPNDDRLMEPP
jgi:transcriptional regulator with XRE-family HTH domain